MSFLALIHVLFSQTSDPFLGLPSGGGAGWAGAGLLGLVLAWLLLKHLPDKDKQIQGLIDSKDAAVKGLIEAKDAAVKEITLLFRDSLSAATTAFTASVEKLSSRDEARTTDLKTTMLAEFGKLGDKLEKLDQRPLK